MVVGKDWPEIERERQLKKEDFYKRKLIFERLKNIEEEIIELTNNRNDLFNKIKLTNEKIRTMRDFAYLTFKEIVAIEQCIEMKEDEVLNKGYRVIYNELNEKNLKFERMSKNEEEIKALVQDNTIMMEKIQSCERNIEYLIEERNKLFENILVKSIITTLDKIIIN